MTKTAMRLPRAIGVLLLVLTSTPISAANKDPEQPDKEMLRMMDFLRDMEMLKQMEMMPDVQHLERPADRINPAPQRGSPPPKKVAR